MENLKQYVDERKCLGIDCAWCLDMDCELSKLPYKKKEENNVRILEQVEKN